MKAKREVTLAEVKAHFQHFRQMMRLGEEIARMESRLNALLPSPKSPRIMSQEEAKYQKGTPIPRDIGLSHVIETTGIEEKLGQAREEYEANATLFARFIESTGIDSLDGMTKRILWQVCYMNWPVSRVAKAAGMSRQAVYQRLLANGIAQDEEEQEEQ